MAFTREQALGALASLKPAAVFLDSYTGKPLPENLDIYFGPPEEFFIAPDTQERYTRNGGGQAQDESRLGLARHLLEAVRGQVMAFIDDHLPVIGDTIVDDSPCEQDSG